MTTEYALYKGENLLHIGTIKEIAKAHGVKANTIRFYNTPCYKKRIAKRRNARNYITLTKLEESE